MQTYHIHINGIVQGVGFRPFAHLLAKEWQLCGFVKNGSDGVHIFINASEQIANSFYQTLIRKAPKQSKIIFSRINKISPKTFSDFAIVVGEDNGEKNVLISPDSAVCISCKNELHDISNRRYRYPFITCTECGPRYAIIDDLPYERQGTSMRHFSMCEICQEEYNDVADRRFFSQTNSCPACGITLSLFENPFSVLSKISEAVLSKIRNFLGQGKIIAVKGIGGYLLLCDANNRESITLLRSRKQRPSKPFALLYPGIEMVRNHFVLSSQEQQFLKSAASPIVLLYPRPEAFNALAVKSIAPRLNRLGIMIPCSPLLDIIAHDYGKPLVATSANISGSPIIYKDQDALDHLFDMADYLVSYNRDITVPGDDSVIRLAQYAPRQIILRRSRGYAPSFLSYHPRSTACVLSTGAFLKSSFTLSVNGNIFISQFLGSGESYESQVMFKDTLSHWLKLYSAKPSVIISDKHPGYFSHQYAIELGSQFPAELRFIQHHQAHFAASLAENELLHASEPVLGVIWDGTGLGDDGNIWGGEFFKYENNEMLRCYHFDYFPVIAGDKLSTEPRIAALCASHDVWIPSENLKKKFTEAEWNNYQSLIQKTTLFSSSVGRLFDAVASLLDICDRQTYEGQGAMYLQALAEEYTDENGFDMNEAYFKEDAHYYRIPTSSLIQAIIIDLKKGKPTRYIAAKFHYSLVSLIEIVAKNIKAKKICFSGGVFQNALLVDWIQKRHAGKYELFFHQNLSPNDENISFGQLVYHDNNIRTALPRSYQQQETLTHYS